MVLTPAMVPSDRSSGVATLDAMISGLAPGRLAETTMTGKSMFGKGATGNSRELTAPSSMIARLSRTVATGRRMKGADRFMRQPSPIGPGRQVCGSIGDPAGRNTGRSPVW